jgi:hypothetical protein
MPITVPRVFISSTSEFAAEREQLKKEIEDLSDMRFGAYVYEAEAAGSEAPEQRLRKVLEGSEIFLIILGDKLGGAAFDQSRAEDILPLENRSLRYLQQSCSVSPSQTGSVVTTPGKSKFCCVMRRNRCLLESPRRSLCSRYS